MLFYIKRHLWLEVMVTVLLGSTGLWAIHALGLPLHVKPRPFDVVLGVVGAAWLGLWTLLVQHSYRVFKGNTFTEQLTASLAKEYANPSPVQILLGGITAACGEEVFFRGFVQQWLGLAVASLLFMLAHFGRKDIRVVSYWSIFQGLYLSLGSKERQVCRRSQPRSRHPAGALASAASSATASPRAPMCLIGTAEPGHNILSSHSRMSANHPNMKKRSCPTVPRMNQNPSQQTQQ